MSEVGRGTLEHVALERDGNAHYFRFAGHGVGDGGKRPASLTEVLLWECLRELRWVRENTDRGQPDP